MKTLVAVLALSVIVTGFTDFRGEDQEKTRRGCDLWHSRCMRVCAQNTITKAYWLCLQSCLRDYVTCMTTRAHDQIWEH
ncbi:hypothetical protein ScPMuIL_013609 [Solemya velum]